MKSQHLMRNIMLLAGSCILSTLLLLIILIPKVRNDKVYLAASIDKEKRLAETEENRIILIGGSGLALGINSRTIERETGKLVVNMGLHAGLGLSFPLNESQESIKKGDLVILCIEHYLSDADVNEKLVSQLIDVNPRALGFFSTTPFDAVRLYIQSVQRCLSGFFYKIIGRNNFDFAYSRESFNKEGDFISHYGKPKPAQLAGNVLFPSKDYSDNISKINHFIEATRKKGAVVIFTYPAFSRTSFERNQKSLAHLSSEYSKLLKCPILGNTESFVLPDQLFFDTVYHLDSVGIQKRTDIMLSLLSQANLTK